MSQHILRYLMRGARGLGPMEGVYVHMVKCLRYLGGNLMRLASTYGKSLEVTARSAAS